MNKFPQPVFLGVNRLSQVFDKVSELSAKLERVSAAGESETSYKSDMMTFRGICRRLPDAEAEHWILMGQGSGMTVYGAAALSWCRGAELDSVFAAWAASGCSLKSGEPYERPARHINPAVLMPTSSLREITIGANGKFLPFYVRIAAAVKPLEFDLSVDVLRKADPQVKELLWHRIRDRTTGVPPEWATILKQGDPQLDGAE